MKKILFLISIILIVITISLKVNYHAHITMSFGNNIKGSYTYLYNHTRVIDLINFIQTNQRIKNRYIQNILVLADNIYIDLNDLEIDKNNLIELNTLLELIRDYTKENIKIRLCDNSNSNKTIINKWIFQIKDKYDIIILGEKR